jgi:ribosomal protein S18 acetylase RimI-like enzyme
MNVTPTIRTAGPGDIDDLRSVFRRASLHNEGDRPNLLAHPEVLEFEDACVHEGRTRVAMVDGRVVGFETTNPNGDAEELDDLFVDPDWMRRGIALALIRDAVAIARARGTVRIEVTGNNHALAFYERAGFVLDGVTETRFGSASRMHLDVV